MAVLHNFGPYNVRHNQVVRGSVPVDKPALLILELPHPTDVGWGFHGLTPVKPR